MRKLSLVLVALIALLAGSSRANATGSTWYVSTTGVDTAPCTQAAPCKTWNRGATVAQPGDTVQIAAGVYGRQVVSANKTGYVFLRPAPGASVKFNAQIVFSGSFLDFDGLSADMTTCVTTTLNPLCPDILVTYPGHDIKLGPAMFAAYFTLTGVWNMTVRGDYGNAFDHHGIIHADTVAAGNHRPHDLDIDVTIHDVVKSQACRNTNCSNHVGGMTINDAYNVNYRAQTNNVEDLCLLVKPGTADVGPNVVIHDSFCGTTVAGFHSADVSDVGTGHLITDVHFVNDNFTKILFVSAATNVPTSEITNSTLPALDCNYANQGFTLSGNHTSSGTVLCPPAADTTPPVLQNMPSNRTAEATSSSGASVTYTNPTATDNRDPNPTVACAPASGTTFALGSTTVTCTATDASGNSSSATFQVSVVDTTAPAMNSLTFSNAQASSVDIAYAASDAVGVTSYDVFLDGTLLFNTASTSSTVSGLSAASHLIEVDARDAAGNVSGRSPLTLTRTWR